MAAMPVDLFRNQVAVVIGGGSGIGKAVCERLRLEGAFVWVLDLDEEAAKAVAATLGEARSLKADIVDRQSLIAAADLIISESRQVDVLVNAAGVTLAGPVWETDPDSWDKVIAVNLTGLYYSCSAFLPIMVKRRKGAVVNIASDAGLTGWPGQSAYCASKGGGVQFTKACALDLAPYDIRMNAVCPAFTDTPLVADWIKGQEDAGKARQEIAAGIPLQRMALPSEIAAAVAFLCSREAHFITGVALPVDGGVTAQANAFYRPPAYGVTTEGH